MRHRKMDLGFGIKNQKLPLKTKFHENGKEIWQLYTVLCELVENNLPVSTFCDITLKRNYTATLFCATIQEILRAR